MQVELVKDTEAVWRLGLRPSVETEQILIDGPGVAGLESALVQVADDERCRVLVLQGEGGAFCQGMDLAFATAERDPTPHVTRFASCLERLRQGRPVVLACVDGAALGGGLGVAAAADLVLATERSSFGLPELTLGLLPAVVLPVLLQRVSPQNARALCLSGPVDADRAFALGLADGVVADADALDKALRGAIKHALRCHPGAVAEFKQLCTEVASISLSAGLERGAAQTAAVLADPSRVAPIKAFWDGEPVPWFDRYRPRKGNS